MSNTLTKDLGVTILSPEVQGSPGTPPTPAYCATTQTTTTTYPVIYLTLEDGSVVAVPGSSFSTTDTETTCYPASPGTPPTAFQPANVTTQFNLGWSAGAKSVASLNADGAATFSVNQAAIGAVVGLDSGTVEFSYGGAEHALYFRNGYASVLENGVVLTGAVPYTVSDVFSIERASSTVRYFKNGALIYTSTAPSYGTQYLEASLYSGGDAVIDAALESTTTVGFGIGSAALMPVFAFGGIASASGYAAFLPVDADGTGVAGTEQYGIAAFLPLAATGSNKVYAGGATVLSPLESDGDGVLVGDAPTFSLGATQLGYIGAAGHGMTSGNTTGETAASELLPLVGLGSDYDYGGGAAEFLPLLSYGAQGVTLGFYAFIESPSAYVYAAGHDSTDENAAYVTMPAATATGWFGGVAEAAIQAPTLAATGTVTGMGAATLVLPSAQVTASGTVSAMAQASVRCTTARLVGYSGAVCSVTMGAPTVAASSTTGSTGQAALTLPLYELTASATMHGWGTAELLMPAAAMGATAQAWLVAPGATLTAIGTAVVAATYEAYAINLGHTLATGAPVVDEATHYTNFPFTHVVRHKNSYYGVNASGLYLLEGSTDDGEPIPWSIKTAMTDFGKSTLKRVNYAYFTGRMGPASTITAYPGEDASVAYAYTTPRGEHVQNHRQVFGKGMKGTFFALGAQGTGVMDLDNIELNVTELSRRI